VPAQRRPDDETSGQVGFAPHEQRDVRVAIAREIGGDAREDTGIDARIDDVAFMIGEQQFPGEPARETSNCRPFAEPSEDPCSRTLGDLRMVRVRQGRYLRRADAAILPARRRRANKAAVRTFTSRGPC